MPQKYSLTLGLIPLLWVALAAENGSEQSHKLASVSVRKMADSVHAVVAANQRSYVELALPSRHADTSPSGASTLSSEFARSPSHAQILRHAAASIQKQGAEFSYTLRSLWPIHPSAGPQTEAEETGLRAVIAHPNKPFYTEEELGGRSYFTAVYAEPATVSSCVSCHNQQSDSPRRDFKLGEVMGAIVVRVPLEF